MNIILKIMLDLHTLHFALLLAVQSQMCHRKFMTHTSLGFSLYIQNHQEIYISMYKCTSKITHPHYGLKPMQAYKAHHFKLNSH